MSTIRIQKISITELDTDAVVNAANEGLWAGGGVCGAIFRAAGHDELQAACNEIGHCDTGSAVITPGFRLKAKYIIHAVGPRWSDGKHGEPAQLYGAYYKSLELAAENGCVSVGFPLISAGIFGYPAEAAWRQAFRACKDFLDKNPDKDLDIIFAVLNDEGVDTGSDILIKSGASSYKIAEKTDWKASEMPQKNEQFVLSRAFTAQQMKALRKGNIPKEMEDKWFWYMEGNTLYAHRSWTGFCIYIIEFRENNEHLVTVNRDPEQYNCTDTAEDSARLNDLLNWWSGSPYDYYTEWLSETVKMLEKQETAHETSEPETVPADMRQARIDVFEDTQAWIREDPELSRSVAAAKDNTEVFFEDDYPDFDRAEVKEEIAVSGYRSYEAAVNLHRQYPDSRIAVMNFASAFHAGGGVRKGAGAQEESLCRTSTLYPLLHRRTLRDTFYKHHHDLKTPKATDSLIYTKGVVICKTDEEVPKRLPKEDWVEVDVITIVAPDLRSKSNQYAPLVGNGTYMNDAELFGYHVKRAIHMLTVAAAKGADILVLGAFGCGAFQNDPNVVARAYKTALQEFPKVFKRVEFAVYCPPEGSRNYDVFKSTF